MTSENAPQASASLHSNTVTIDDKASKTITSISYIAGSLQISSGQPSKVPPSIKVNNSAWEITLEAGRHKTSEVANAFNSLCGGKGKEYAPSGGGGAPKELNFFFGLTLYFNNGGAATIYIGQGSYGSTNNWWIGGAPIFSLDKPRLEYQAGPKIVTNVLSGDHKTFALKQTDIRPVSPIQNVFVLMLENHSFDNMLALSGIPGIYGATKANCNSWKGQSGPTQVCFGPGAPASMPTDPGHEFPDVLQQLTSTTKLPLTNGYPPISNAGFAQNYATSNSEKTGLPKPPEVGDIMLGFQTKDDLPALYDLANNFAVCDRWFSSLPGPTWPNRFFLHGASSNGLDRSPTTWEILEWEAPDGLGFTYPHGSIFDRMKKMGITWRLYNDRNGPLEGSVAQVSSLHGIEIWDVHDVKDFERDVQSKSYPYQYTFIEPNYGDVASDSYEDGTSQHPMDSVVGGEGLITAVYEAIRNSPIWQQSLLIITYDEHGGFYDHYPPGPATPPGDGGHKYSKYNFDFTQYGVRVPAVAVSPYINQGVDHTIYDHSSVLATLEYLFGLPPLTNRDASATGLHLLLSETMRTDTPTKLRRPTKAPAPRKVLSAAERAAMDLKPVPEGSTLMGMLGVLLKADSKMSGSAAARARFAMVKTRGDARVYMREVLAKVELVRAKLRAERAATPSATPPSG